MKDDSKKDILIRKLKHLFPDENDRNEVLSVLNAYGKEKHEQEPDRVKLAILKVSGSNLELIKQNTDYAKEDFRDILVAAEYPNQSKKWSHPDGPEKQELIHKDRLQYEHWLVHD